MKMSIRFCLVFFCIIGGILSVANTARAASVEIGVRVASGPETGVGDPVYAVFYANTDARTYEPGKKIKLSMKAQVEPVNAVYLLISTTNPISDSAAPTTLSSYNPSLTDYNHDFMPDMNLANRVIWSQDTYFDVPNKVGDYYIHVRVQINIPPNYTYMVYSGTRYAFMTVPIKVAVNRPPTPPIIADPPIEAKLLNFNQPYSFSFKSTDPDDNAIFYEIDWNSNGSIDERIPAIDIKPINLVVSGYKVFTAHTFSTGSNMSVKARAGDSKGLYSEWSSREFNVTNSPPTPPAISTTAIAPYFIKTNYPFTFVSTDPNGDGIDYGIDWVNKKLGTADYVIGQMIPAIGSGYLASGVPTTPTLQRYTAKGDNLIHARAFDSKGAFSTWTEYPFHISNRAPLIPTITLSSTNDNYAGFTHYQGISVLGTDPDGDDLQYTVDWGDSTPPKLVTSVVKNADNPFIPTHSYANPGTYTITADSTDNDIVTDKLTTALRSPKATKQITISPAPPPVVTILPCKQILPANITGWGWSSTIGWISLGSGNDYGVSVDKNNGNVVVGCAWSSNIGWIMFGSAVTSGFPSEGNSDGVAKIVGGVLKGWARACAGTADGVCTSMASRTDGWDGWIELSGTTHAVNYSYDSSTQKGSLSGWAWGGPVVGWISFGTAVQEAPFCRFDNPQMGTPNITGVVDGETAKINLKWSSNGNYCTIKGPGVDEAVHRSPTESNGLEVTAKNDATYSLNCFRSDGTPINQPSTSLEQCTFSPVTIDFRAPVVAPTNLTLTVSDTRGFVTSDSEKNADQENPPTYKVRKGKQFTLKGTQGSRFTTSQCTVRSYDEITKPALPTDLPTGDRDIILGSGKNDMSQGSTLVKYTLSCIKNRSLPTEIEAQTSLKVQLINPSIEEK